MKCLCIPGWATSPDIFSDLLPDNLISEEVDFNFFNDLGFPENEEKEIDTILCYSLGSLYALTLMERVKIQKVILIGGFTYFPGEDKRRKLKISLMIRGLKKNPEKVLTDFYKEAELPEQSHDKINVNNLIRGLELLRDCDMSHALLNNDTKLYTIHGDQDSIVPEELNRMQFKDSKHFSLEGNHSIILTKAKEIKKIISEII